MDAEKLHLHLWIVHPDQLEFYGSLPFLLMAMWQGLRELGEDSPFGITYTQGEFENRLRQEAENILVTAGFEGEKNHPRDVDLDDLDDDAWDAYWANEDGLPQCWIWVEFKPGQRPEALTAGVVWETSAWNL